MMRTLLAKLFTLQNGYSVHPPNPPLKRKLLLVLVLLSMQSAILKAQEKPRLDSLEIALKTYLNKQWTAERKQFTVEQKGKALNFIPSLGYGMRGPTISYSTQQLFGYLESKKVRAVSLEAIDRRYELLFNEELNKLRIEYEKTSLQEAKLKILETAINTDRKIFNIYAEAYKKQELKPLEYFQKQKQFEDIQNQLNLFKQEYFITILEIKKLAHYGVQDNSLFFEETDCIMLEPGAVTRRKAKPNDPTTSEKAIRAPVNIFAQKK
jgi:hypothetical protein